MSRYLFTSESVTEGHPDKVSDAVSDAVLDAALAGDKTSRVACETLCKTGFVVLAGEITTKATIDFGKVARNAIKNIGYTSSEMGFDADTCGILIAIEPQSPDISQGVTEGEGLFKEQGAGDQGLMFGYACDETPELMPSPIRFAHKLIEMHRQHFESGEIDFLRPDAKSQVTIEYAGDRPRRIQAVVLSTQHSPDVSYDQLRKDVVAKIIKPALPAELLDDNTVIHVNPTGRFVVGGPMGDAGLTGRKIIVDTYGGMGRHGGGAFSGKDPSKVDRSAAYAMRWVAKNLVAAGLARYGMTREAARILTALHDAATHLEFHRMPELFCGFKRRPGDGPTLYPVACAPQAWSAGAVFLLLQACLGLRVDAGARRLELRDPVLPEFLDTVTLEGLTVGGGSVDLVLRRHGDDVPEVRNSTWPRESPAADHWSSSGSIPSCFIPSSSIIIG